MDSEARIHVIAKANIVEHKVITLQDSSLSALRDGHVRIRSAVIALSRNNLSYALLGTAMFWWDAYPVPASLRAPYNDQSLYGIDPTWGYGEIMESKVSGIEAGMLLWGFLPTHDLPVDLKLNPADTPGQWIETSEQRTKLFNLYQRYVVPDPNARMSALNKTRLDEMAWEASCRPVWEAGYLLNKGCFGSAPIHPMADGKWDESDADLSSAVVISLSASGKTARGFTDGLINNRSTGTGPLGLLAITSIPSSDFLSKASFPTKALSYDAMIESDTLGWLAAQKPRKIVVTDFGGRGDSLLRLLEALQKSFSDVEIVTIGIGGSSALKKPEDLGKLAQRNAGISSRVQMNTTKIRDVALQTNGTAAYFKDLMSAWQAFSKSDSVKDLKLEVGNGVEGSDGFEGGWTRLCGGQMPSDVAMAYRF